MEYKQNEIQLKVVCKSSLIQQELLETLYVVQAPIKPVHKQKFYS